VEHSVHVREYTRGRGIGTKLLSELIQLAANAGKHVMVAAIDSGNQGSIDLHSKFGFLESARMREVATKNGRLLTLVLMQKLLKDA
jgi:phosphinothricin acetyltransferase